MPPNAGALLRQQATGNLRKLRIETGFDYAGVEIHGTSVFAVPDLDMAGVRERIPQGAVADTRVIVSELPIADTVRDQNFGLILTISRGDQFAWSAGLSTLAADVRVTRDLGAMQLSAVVLDVFQELMLANCASIQAVLAKFIASGGSQDAFYRAKADFAGQLIARGEATTLFQAFAPDRYACFATLARADLAGVMDIAERARFASLWSQFLQARFTDHFLDIDEAVELVLYGSFHRARAERTAQGGVAPGARQRFGFIKEAELRRELGDRQRVLHTGAYVLCLLTGKPSAADLGKVGAKFGWKRPGVPKLLRLCTEDKYNEMVPLVRRGLVTPLRLFLKAS